MNDVVSYAGSSYVANAANQGPNNPTPDQNAAAWSVMAQQGVAGAKGDTGPPGQTGAQGAVGQIGPQGPIGPAGSIGPQGLQGPPGVDGAQGPQGPAGTTGQSAQTVYQTSSLDTVSFSFAQLPGMSITVSVPANSTVIVAADGGIVVNSTSPTTAAVSVVDVTLEVDGAGSNSGTFKRILNSNSSTVVQLPTNWSFSKSMSLSPGLHTFSVVGRLFEGIQALIGDGPGTILQSELTVTILNR